MKRILFLALVVSLLGTGACTNAPKPQTSKPAVSGYPSPEYPDPASLPSGYPAPTANTTYPYPFFAPPQSAYPYPVAEQPAVLPSPTPTQDPTLGIIKGRLLEGKNPIVNYTIFLAEVKKDEKGTELAAKYSAAESPRVVTQPDGSFTFVNVVPGRYALILSTGMNAFLINIPDKTDPILLTVETGKTVDLGDLSYDELPK